MEVHEDFRYQAGRFTRRRAYGGEQQLAGYFVQETFRPSPDWSIHLGVRLDQWRLRDGHQNQLDLETGLRAPTTRFADRSVDVLDPTLGVAYQATPSTALRASLYSGFRAPVLFDLYRAGSNTLRSNPDLEPERLRGAEVGVHVDPAGRWSLDLAAYWNEVENPIINRTTGIAGPTGGVVPPCGAIGPNATCRQKDNLDELRSRGIEAAVTWRPSPQWDVRWNYAFLDSVVTAARLNPELVGLETRQAPRHSSALSANWSGSRLGLGASLRYVGDRFDDDLNRFALGDFVLLDLHLSRDLGRSLAVFVNGRNLLADQYVIGDSGVLVEIGPPRQLGAGLRLRIDRR
jgi:outer membrane receptor protein involved in Fe transport